MLKKIQKHLTIAQTRLRQKEVLAAISKYENKTLQIVIDSLLRVINNDFQPDDYEAFERCENTRDRLLLDETVISYAVFGSDKTALVKDICRQGASSKKGCRFLYALSKNTKRAVVLEIGTNVGMSGSYILEGLKSNKESFFVTMEGLPQLCELANKQFASIVPESKFEIKQGLFDTTFSTILEDDKQFNLLFIDGNHQKEPTLEYFIKLKNKISSPAILVFDDINWSNGMKEAWGIIKKDPAVNFAIDLYRQGIVIIDKDETTKNEEFSLHLSY